MRPDSRSILFMIQKVIVVLAVLGAFYMLLRVFERKNIYFPAKRIVSNPGYVNLPYEDVYLETEDGEKIHGWLLLNDSKEVLLYCHGNGGNISHRLEPLSFFHSMGLSVLIFDYRGYGNSSGFATEKGTYLDAEAAYGFLLERGFKAENIVLYGKSLGANIAAHIAANRKVGGLIMESAFTSVMDMAESIYGFRPPGKFLNFEYNALKIIESIKIPKLIIHSVEDEIVPFEHGEKLYRTASPPVNFLQIKGGHNAGYSSKGKKYREKLENFIKEL